MRLLAIPFFVGLALAAIHPLQAQTLGGGTVFHFANQPNTAQLSALGGVNISQLSNDAGLAFHNPALLRPALHGWTNASFNNFIAGINQYSVTSVQHVQKAHSTLGIGLQYFDYGTLAQTDASGNILGNFRPADYVVQIMAATTYKNHWHFGATFKWLQSAYGPYRSNGVAVDVGLTFCDTANGWQASLVVKNMGTQLKTYDGSSQKQELPFDLQAGVSKRLVHAPLQFSLTAHHLQALSIYYNDTSFAAGEGVSNHSVGLGTKILGHLVASTQWYVGDKIEVTAGYNFLRRRDVNLYNAANGLNGFTCGLGLLLSNLQLRFATGFYQQHRFQQFSLNVRL